MTEEIEVEPDSDQWRAVRATGLGASDAAAALDLTPWKSPYALWAEKVGEVDSPDFGMRGTVGKKAEPMLAELFEEETGMVTELRNLILRSTDHPFMLATPDRYIGDDTLVELKTADTFAHAEWEDGKVPVQYQIQGQHQLYVSERRRVFFAVLIGWADFRVIEMERNENLIDLMVKQETDFWSLVEARTPPATDGSDATTAALKSRFPGGDDTPYDLGAEGQDLVSRVRNLRALKKLAETECSTAENELKELLGNHTVGHFFGNPVVTYRAQTRKSYVVNESTFRVLRPVGKE